MVKSKLTSVTDQAQHNCFDCFCHSVLGKNIAPVDQHDALSTTEQQFPFSFCELPVSVQRRCVEVFGVCPDRVRCAKLRDLGKLAAPSKDVRVCQQATMLHWASRPLATMFDAQTIVLNEETKICPLALGVYEFNLDGEPFPFDFGRVHRCYKYLVVKSCELGLIRLLRVLIHPGLLRVKVTCDLSSWDDFHALAELLNPIPEFTLELYDIGVEAVQKVAMFGHILFAGAKVVALRSNMRLQITKKFDSLSKNMFKEKILSQFSRDVDIYQHPEGSSALKHVVDSLRSRKQRAQRRCHVSALNHFPNVPGVVKHDCFYCLSRTTEAQKITPKGTKPKYWRFFWYERDDVHFAFDSLPSAVQKRFVQLCNVCPNRIACPRLREILELPAQKPERVRVCQQVFVIAKDNKCLDYFVDNQQQKELQMPVCCHYLAVLNHGRLTLSDFANIHRCFSSLTIFAANGENVAPLLRALVHPGLRFLKLNCHVSFPSERKAILELAKRVDVVSISILNSETVRSVQPANDLYNECLQLPEFSVQRSERIKLEKNTDWSTSIRFAAFWDFQKLAGFPRDD